MIDSYPKGNQFFLLGAHTWTLSYGQYYNDKPKKSVKDRLQESTMQRLSSNFASFEEILRPLIGVLGVLFALAATIAAAVERVPGDDAGSSRADTYVGPTFEDSVDLEMIRGDIFYAVNHIRVQEDHPDVGPLVVDFQLQNAAQRHAEGNAATGKYAPLNGDRAMIQGSIPQGQATGHNVMQLNLDDQPNSDLMVNPEHLRLGVGIAQSRGHVWFVIAFSRD